MLNLAILMMAAALGVAPLDPGSFRAVAWGERGGQDPPYDTVLLEAGSRADKILAPDLDRDGHPDLVIQSARDLHFYFFDKARGFSPKPQQTVRLDPTVFLWSFGSLEGQKLPGLLTEGSRGIQGHAFDGRAFGPAVDLVVHPTLFEGISAEGKAPLHFDFAPDLDRDGRSEILLFQKDKIFLMKQGPGGEFRCLQKLPIPVEVATLIPWTAHQKLTETAAVPLLAFGDVDGDGRPDISYYRDEAIGVFKQEAGGLFTSIENLDLAAEHRRRRSGRFFQFEVPPRVGDFNGDGLLDLALVYPSKGRVHVYFGHAGRNDFSQPDQVMQVADGWATGIYIEDLQGRGKSDLIMGVVRKFGITGGIQVFVSGKVDLELHIYPMEANGRFTKDPVQQLKFSIPFSFHMTREAANLDLIFRPNFKGDYNKDGLRDMLVAVDEKTLQIYPGVRERFISDQPGGTILLNPPPGVSMTEPFVADFNGDGVSDLVLKHVLSDPTKHALELKLSK